MRQLFAVIFSMLLWQQSALGQLGENSAPLTAEFAHIALTKTMSASMAQKTQKALHEGMQNYANQPRSFEQFVSANAKSFSKQDLDFLNSIAGEFPKNVSLPSFRYNQGRYETSALGATIAFSTADYWKNHIYVNGKMFKLNYAKGLAAIYQDLQKQFPAKATSSLVVIDDAQAFIPLIAWLVLLVIGGLGVSFWMKSANEKKRIMQEALIETSKDISAQAKRCEQSRDDSAAYEDTFGLMKNMITGDGEGNMISESIHAAMFRSIEEQSNLDCGESLKQVFRETLGDGAATFSAAAKEAKNELCGYLGNDNGAFNRLRNCMARFYSTHKEITQRRRNITPSRFDRDAELIRDSRQYQNTLR